MNTFGRPLDGLRFLEVGHTPSGAYAGRLLCGLGAEVVKLVPPHEPSPGWYDLGKTVLQMPDTKAVDTVTDLAQGVNSALFGGVIATLRDPEPLADWAVHGALFLRGPEPQAGPGRLLAHLRGAALAARMVGRLTNLPVDVGREDLLSERRACGQPPARHPHCRLVRVQDGWIAVNLPRPQDPGLVSVWLGAPGPTTVDRAWAAIERAAPTMTVAHAVAGAQDSGLAVAAVVPPEMVTSDTQAVARGQSWPPAPYLIDGRPAHPEPPSGEHRVELPARRNPADLLIVDLTTAWAGPLATSLMCAAGARVVKVEDTNQPDPARRGGALFFDLLNAGKQAAALDLRTAPGLAALHKLIGQADIVFEGVGPRGVAHLGIDPGEWLAERQGRIWAGITGYGRTGPAQDYTAYGDDAAVAAGVAAMAGTDSRPRLCGDALAEPVAGLHALVATLAARCDGESHLIDIALRESLGHAIGDPTEDPACAVPDVGRMQLVRGRWYVDGDLGWPAMAPMARKPAGLAPPLGAHTNDLIGAVGQKPAA